MLLTALLTIQVFTSIIMVYLAYTNLKENNHSLTPLITTQSILTIVLLYLLYQ